MIRKLFWLVVIGAAVWTAVVWRGQLDLSKGPEKEKVSEGGKGVPGELEQKIMSFTIDGRSPKGVRQWHLEGSSAEIIGEEIHLDDLKATAFGDGATVNLTSDSGIYRKNKGEVELIGNVRVVSDKGGILTSERAKWSQITKEISTDTMVRIEQEGMVATGRGGMANSEQGKAVLEKEVEVFVEPGTEVKCDGPLEVFYDDSIAVFFNDVKVKDKDGELFADKLTVEIDPGTRKLARVVAEGNVKVKRGNSYTLSEKAIYTESTKSAKLLGKPRVIIAPEEVDQIQGLGGKQ